MGFRGACKAATRNSNFHGFAHAKRSTLILRLASARDDRSRSATRTDQQKRGTREKNGGTNKRKNDRDSIGSPTTTTTTTLTTIVVARPF